MNKERVTAANRLIESFKDRFPGKAFKIHPNIQIQKSTGEGGLQIVATTGISKDEILMTIPKSAQLTVPNFIKNVKDAALKKLITKLERTINENFEEIEDFRDYSLPFVMMYILTSKNKLSSSPAVNHWTLQAETWPSVEEMKQSSIFYLEESFSVEDQIGKSQVSTIIDGKITLLRQVFEKVVVPLLKEFEQLDNIIVEEDCWETFRYAYSLFYSRAHESTSSGSKIIPIIELINGVSELEEDHDYELINVETAPGNYLTANGREIPITLLVTTRDILAGEELIISYGNIAPNTFLNKYGFISKSILTKPQVVDDVALYCPRHLVPKDHLRQRALFQLGCPVEEIRNGTMPFPPLTGYDFDLFLSNQEEPEALKAIRQILILSCIATDEEVLTNIRTFGLKTRHIPKKSIGKLILEVIDHNLQLLSSSKIASKNDFTKAQETDNALLSSLFVGRICQREALFQWRRLLEQYYELEPSNLSKDTCHVCGRSYPRKICSRCQCADTSTAYCTKKHQKQDWKQHKKICRPRPK